MEEYAILMLAFAAILFLYAGILAEKKDVRLIPRYHASGSRSKQKKDVETVAKVTGLTAVAPLASALIARLTDAAMPSLLVLILGLVLLPVLGAHLTRRTR